MPILSAVVPVAVPYSRALGLNPGGVSLLGKGLLSPPRSASLVEERCDSGKRGRAGINARVEVVQV